MSKIVIAKDQQGNWRATRTTEDKVIELAAPSYYSADGLAKWCKNGLAKWCEKRYPHDTIGITAADIGPRTAA